MCPDHPENKAGLSKFLQNHCLCAFVANLEIDVIYVLYPESFCDKNLAIRKVFPFCDSDYRNIWQIQTSLWTKQVNGNRIDYIGGHFCKSYSTESQEISLPGLVLEQLSGKLRLPPYFPPNHPTPNGNEGKFNCYICSRPLPVFRGRSGRGERIKSTARRRHQKLCHAGSGMLWRVW